MKKIKFQKIKALDDTEFQSPKDTKSNIRKYKIYEILTIVEEQFEEDSNTKVKKEEKYLL